MPQFFRDLVLFFAVFAIFGVFQIARAEEQPSTPPASPMEIPPAENNKLSVEEVRAILNSIDPYLPGKEISGEIDLFGSTTMDALVHGWATGFTKFHPEANIVISAEGSETVFDRLSKNPTSIGMLSRPVTPQDLDKLKSMGLKRPVAIYVARDAMGVYVHKSNPLESITYPQLVSLFCRGDASNEPTWSTVAVEGDLADKPVQIIGRDKNSGTQRYIEDFLFHTHNMRKHAQNVGANAEVISAIAENPQGIGIADLKHTNPSVKRLGLEDKHVIHDGDEHEVLLGQYPMIRPLTLVMDLGQNKDKVAANKEFIRYALAQTGQTQDILAGFFPFDPPTLRNELSKLIEEDSPPVTDAELKKAE
ncbi:substrate-binding domain-containing protein [Bremerella sp. P1]|uniref:substrate-binding domain-containing protein n=1 Tax=Bremerella sp. P1 TaxID=3026424 RepID=UPI0023679536|nr:substrate-binding domain-containing protein [Bremerella sp. P1]WDI43822.1 substrate-binding domain-containing protein [Bremerella sp. P1]